MTTFEERFIIFSIIVVGLLTLLAPDIKADSQSFDYQVNVSIVACQLINGSLTGCSVNIESGGQVRSYNTSITQNNTFLGTLIANLSDIQCPRQTCNLNTTTVVNQGNVTVICPAVNVTCEAPVCAVPQVPSEIGGAEDTYGIFDFIQEYWYFVAIALVALIWAIRSGKLNFPGKPNKKEEPIKQKSEYKKVSDEGKWDEE